MEYTISKLSKIAGVSTRTLRYYDEIKLLEPARINSSGYRIYGKEEVDRLQQILFYKELGFELCDIKRITASPDFDHLKALNEHLNKLLTKKERLNALIANLSKTIKAVEGEFTMTDREKFEGFKQKLIDENEAKYGKEIREKYGDETVNKSNKKLLNIKEEQFAEFKKLEEELADTLKEAIKTKNPSGELGLKAADLHKRWLMFSWDKYSKEAHVGLANMYVSDERFKEYYEKIAPGAAEFLRDAILCYTGFSN